MGWSRLRLLPAAAVLALIGCGISTTVDPGTVQFESFAFAGCDLPGDPLPGWRDCHATVSLTVTKTVRSGYVTVIINYPDDGSFYHGSYVTTSSKPGHFTYSIKNQYISHCVTSYATQADVYDGPDGAQTATLLASIPLTLHATC